MHERSQTTPRRRGPKHPLPRQAYADQQAASESPYYTIDNTEDIYGTTLLPSQRCYVDPWDLENYDYVRKKISATPLTKQQQPTSDVYYESSLSPSPVDEQSPYGLYGYNSSPPPIDMAGPRMSATMPRNLRKSSQYQCEMPCCTSAARSNHYQDGSQSLYGSSSNGGHRYPRTNANKYEDYMTHMTEDMMMMSLVDEELDQNIYNGYGGISSSSSTERHSSIGDVYGHSQGTVSTATMRRRSSALRPTPPRIEFPPPPPTLNAPTPPGAAPSTLAPSYDYCNPYATLPYCSVSDCYECLSQSQAGRTNSLIYAAPSTIYGGHDGRDSASLYYGSSTLGRPRRPSSSLYAGIYANKFGLSKKGLLQIDYSCSWNDLDRVMGRQY